MKTRIFLTTFLTALIVLTSCGPQHIIHPEGQQQSRNVQFNTKCTELLATHTFHITVDHTLPAGIAVITTDKAIMDHLHVKSNQKEIVFKLKKRWTISSIPIEVRIAPGNFNEFHAVGASQIYSEYPIFQDEIEVSATGTSTIHLKNVHVDDVEADATGSSRILLAGKANSLEMKVTGMSEIDTRNLQCDEADIDATGTSTIWVNAHYSITGKNIGMSTIYYIGNPKRIAIEEVGLSSVKQVEETTIVNPHPLSISGALNQWQNTSIKWKY